MRPRSSGFPRWPASGGTRAARWRRCTSSIRCGSATSGTRRQRGSAAIPSSSTASRVCASSISAAAAGFCREPLARLGAAVVGADPSETNIEAAKLHAAQIGPRDRLPLHHRGGVGGGRRSVRHRAGDGGGRARRRCAVCSSQSCAAMVKPGGLMIAATLNRTLKSFALAIVGAEYILRWLPRRHASAGTSSSRRMSWRSRWSGAGFASPVSRA